MSKSPTSMVVDSVNGYVYLQNGYQTKGQFGDNGTISVISGTKNLANFAMPITNGMTSDPVKGYVYVVGSAPCRLACTIANSSLIIIANSTLAGNINLGGVV